MKRRWVWEISIFFIHQQTQRNGFIRCLKRVPFAKSIHIINVYYILHNDDAPLSVACLTHDDIVFGESNRIKRYFMAWHRFRCCRKWNHFHQKIYSTGNVYLFFAPLLLYWIVFFYDVLIRIQIMYSITLHHSKRIYPKLIQSRLIYRNGKETTKRKQNTANFNVISATKIALE